MFAVEVNFELSLQTSFLLFSSAHYTYTWRYNNIPVNKYEVLRTRLVFYFFDFMLFFVFLSRIPVMVIVFQVKS